jgi:hypothetical protein
MATRGVRSARSGAAVAPEAVFTGTPPGPAELIQDVTSAGD